MPRPGSTLAFAGGLLALGGAGAAAFGGGGVSAVGIVGLVGAAFGVALLVAARGAAAPIVIASGSADAAEAEVAAIADQASRLARGEPLTRPARGDAMVALHGVADKMTAMVEARAHIVATERDLDQARRMYRQILPLSSASEHGGVALAGSSSPAAETGGDWWTYRRLTGGRHLLVIGDATGHGVHSAMVGCMAHGAVRALTQLGEDHLSPRRVLDAVHSAIKIPGVDHAAMTLFAAMVDPDKQQVDYVNYGHVFPLVARRDADGTIVDVSSVTGARDAEELAEDSMDLEVRTGTCALPPGSVLVCFTDGLIERARADGRVFGVRRLQQVLSGATVGPGVAGLAALRDQLLAKVEEHADGAPIEDDVTLVLCGR